jgi:ribosomal protein S18 acetylase RimI-like enzyme
MYCDFQEKYRKSLIELYKEIWKEPPWNEFFWTDEMVNEDIDFAIRQKDFIGKLAVLLNKYEVVGFTWGYELPIEKFPFLRVVTGGKTFYVDELAVRSGFRRRGIGSTLSKMLMKEAEKLGYDTVVLRTDVNAVAYVFYKKLGFEDTNIRDPQYPQRTYMKKRIGSYGSGIG